MEREQVSKAEVSVHGTARKGEYRIELPDADGIARLGWTGEGTVRTATHTYVPASMRGRGIAGQLMERMIADAREQGFSILPQCSYVVAAFERNPHWADVLAQG